MIAILGKGGHAAVLGDFFRDAHCLGVNDEPSDDEYLVLGIGDIETRMRLVEKYGHDRFMGLNNAYFVSVRAVVDKTAQLLHGSIIQTHAEIRAHVIVNTGACVDHHCFLGEFSFVGPNVTLCGNVFVGKMAFIGAGATVLPGINIGARAIVGAGSVVTRNVEAGAVVKGVPAKKAIRSDISLYSVGITWVG